MGSDRERFLTEVEKNFSVQASAGTGKTTSIVGRILNLARWGLARGCVADVLGSLVVVTYTNRAADEMRERLRTRILEDEFLGRNPEVRRGLAGMFVGTIHSWCMRLIEEFAGRYGYCAPDMGVRDEVRIDAGFGRFSESFFEGYQERYGDVLRFFTADEISRMAKALVGLSVDWNDVCEENDLKKKWGVERVIELLEKDERESDCEKFLKVKKSAQFIHERWVEFRDAVKEGKPFCAVPPKASSGGALFVSWFNKKREALVDVLVEGAMLAAMEEARLRQEYEFRMGSYSFNGQIVLAYRLLKMKEVRDTVLGRGYRVILDEAQDTDPLQFKLLMEITRPVDSDPYDWPKGGGQGPRSGHFCMVGDKQQAIYSDRSRLKDYQFYHDALTMDGVGEALILVETYRCRKNIVCWVNDRFSKILNGQNGQAQHVPLVAVEREDGNLGCVEHWTVEGRSKWGGKFDYYIAAEALIKRIAELGCKGLGVKSWSEVAILAPRLNWLEYISKAALKYGVPTMEEFTLNNTDRIEWRWVAAILALDEDAGDEYEVAAVLREILGYADEEIYRYKFSDDGSVRNLVLSEQCGEGRVGAALNNLWNVRQVSKHLGLAAKIEFWCEALRLKERIMSIDPGAAGALDGLLMEAWEHERSGWGAKDWLKKMRAELTSKGDRSPSSRAEGLELLSMQKAKGLEWEVVVVPFFWLEINLPNTPYPKVAVDWSEGSPKVEGAFKSDLRSTNYESWNEREKEEKIREYKRFYYVASTRAKRRLILVEEDLREDRNWSNTLGIAAITSSEEGREYNEHKVRNWMMSMGDVDWACSLNSSLEPDKKNGVEDVLQIEPLKQNIKLKPPVPVELGSKAATDGLLKWAESYQIKAKEPFWVESDAVTYGLWWHQLIEGWPWGREEKVLAAYISKMKNLLEYGNLNLRAERELDLFMNGQFYEWILNSGVSFFQELRYFDVNVGAERVIDFMFQSLNEEWYLVDWKTETTESTEDFLSNEYKKQISEYSHGVKAAGIVLKKAFIYSTVMGKAFEISC